MAALDGGNIAFSRGPDESVVVQDSGAVNTATLAMLTGELTWTETPRTAVEIRNNGRRLAGGVVVRETDDNDCTMTMGVQVSSFLGASVEQFYEIFEGIGFAAAWVSTTDGDAFTTDIVVTYDSTAAQGGGGSQTVTFSGCRLITKEIDPGGQDGTAKMTCTFTCYINRPTPA